MGSLRTITKDRLKAMVAEVVGDEGYRQRVTAMGERFREIEAAQPSVAYMEEMAATGHLLAPLEQAHAIPDDTGSDTSLADQQIQAAASMADMTGDI
jgi:hypothetical protein